MAKFVWQDGTLVSKAKVEIGGTIYEVDPEEYSGSTPLSASNLNAMVDSTYSDLKDYVDKKQTYSTDEIVVGTWLGKPLYRKVYSTILKSGTANIPINLTNVSIKKMESLISISSSNNAFPGNVYRGDTTTQSCYIAGGNIIFSTQYDRTGYELNVVLEYTKTTN